MFGKSSGKSPNPTPHYGWSLDFQLKALAVFIKFKQFYGRLKDCILPQYFESQDLYIICKCVLDYVESYKTMPPQTDLEVKIVELCNRMGHPPDMALRYSHQIYHMEILETEFVIERVLKFGRFQALRSGIMEAIDMLDTEDESEYGKILQSFTKALKVGTDIGSVGFSLLDSLENFVNFPEEAMNKELHQQGYRIPIGIPAIDEAMCGGLSPGELGVVVAPSKVGKSTTLVHFAKTALITGKDVLYYTFELQESDVGLRMAAALTGVDLSRSMYGDTIVRNGKSIHVPGSLDGYKRQAADVFNSFGQDNVPHFISKYYPPNYMTVTGLESHLAELMLRKDFRPDIIFVDYADKLRPDASMKTDNTNLIMGDIYTALIRLGQTYKCPIWTASQTQRWSSIDDDGHLVTVDKVAESWRKIQDADVIITLSQSVVEKTKKLMRMWLAGARRSLSNTLVQVQVDYGKSTLIQKEILDLATELAKKGKKSKEVQKEKVP